MKWGLWSVTAGSNSATPPDGWPEGQAPSTVNDCAREMMAQIRTGINNIQFVDLGVTPTETGNTTFTLPGNQMQWYPYGNRVQANVGGNLLYGTVISSSYTTNTGVTLRFDTGQAVTGQQLTNSLSAVATGFPSAVNGALPEIVYRRMNPIINSCMDFWQRGASFNLSGGGILNYTADRWQIIASLTSGASLNVSRWERSASASFVPTVAQAGVLINNAIAISVSAAYTTVNANSYCGIVQKIEGYTYRQIAQKPITVSFWVNSRQTGTYCVALQNAGQNQACVQQYSISSVATWEKKTISFPKPPVTGTWDYSTGIGLSVWFMLAGGSGVQVTNAGAWTAANLLVTSAQTNFLVSAGNVFAMTGVQIDEGNQATPLQPVDYPTEVNRCLRYHQALLGGGSAFNLQGNATAANSGIFVVPALQTMRANISATWPTPITNTFAYNIGAAGISISAVAIDSTTPYNVAFQLTQQGAGNMTAGQGCFASWQALYIQLDAEL